MNMNPFRREPIINAVPTPSPIMPKTAGAIAFLDEHETMRQDLAYYQQQCELLSKDVKVANETIRRLESELAYVRDDRDLIYQHDASVTNSLSVIATIIQAEMAKARNVGVKTAEQTENPGDKDRLAAVEAALANIDEPQE